MLSLATESSSAAIHAFPPQVLVEDQAELVGWEPRDALPHFNLPEVRPRRIPEVVIVLGREGGHSNFFARPLPLVVAVVVSSFTPPSVVALVGVRVIIAVCILPGAWF